MKAGITNNMKILPKTNKKIFLVSLFFLVLFYPLSFILYPSATHAQEAPRTMTIVPPAKDFTMNPGDRTEGQLKFINDGETPLSITVTTQDFLVEDTHGTPIVLPAGTLGKRFSAAAWIGVLPSTFTVAPHQKQIVTFYLNVPADARPGGHYAAIVYSPSNLLGVKGTGASVQTKIGTLFSLDVAGQITEEAVVSNFTSDGFSEYGPVHIFTQIKNYGDLHIKPLGEIVVKNMFGQRVAVLPFDAHNIFPTAARDYVNLFDGQWMIGRYSAQFLATYGRHNNLPLMASLTFFVFPWKVTLILILLIIAAILGWLVWERREKIKAWEEHMRVHHSETPKTPSEAKTPDASKTPKAGKK